jgi:hypothetical protein
LSSGGSDWNRSLPKENCCGRYSGMDDDTGLTEINSCQGARVFMAARAWQKLTFICGRVQHRICHQWKYLILPAWHERRNDFWKKFPEGVAQFAA